MRSLKRSLIGVWSIVLAMALVAGCWGPPWPQRDMVIDLRAANTSYDTVQKFADAYLRAHGFKLMEKAGYDAIKGTRTIFDYEGSDRVFASVGPEDTRDTTKCKAVLISFDQNRKDLSPQANQAFDALVDVLKKRWPGAVSEKILKHKGTPD